MPRLLRACFAWFCLGCVGILATPGRSLAHALGAECKVHGDKVRLEAYYDDDTPAVRARVHVVDDRGTRLHEGRTDGAGRWSFPKPGPGKYRVVVDAGAGHRTEVAFAIDVGTTSSSSEGVPEGTTVSEGPTRAEFTRWPWARVTLGILAILGFSALLWLIRRQSHARPSAVQEGEKNP